MFDGAGTDLAQTEGAAPRMTRVADIITAAALHFRVSESDIKGSCRRQEFAVPRQIVMHLARQMTSSSFPVIARVIGGKHHTSVLWGDRKITLAIRDGRADTIAHVQAIREMVLTGKPWSELRSHRETLDFVARREAEEARRHVEKMKQLRKLRDLANAGFIANPAERVMAS